MQFYLGTKLVYKENKHRIDPKREYFVGTSVGAGNSVRRNPLEAVI